MSKMIPPWPHGPLTRISDRVSYLIGEMPRMPLKRVMAVIELEREGTRSVLLHNAVRVEDEVMSPIERLGRIEAIIVPGSQHRMDAAFFASRYPNAKVLCPANAKTEVGKVTHVDGIYEDFASDGVTALHSLKGTDQKEGVIVIKEPEHTTLVFNDLIFNMPHLHGVQGFVLKHITQSSGGPCISRIGRWLLVKNKNVLRQELRELSQLPNLKTIMVGHHDPIRTDAKQSLQQIAETL